MKGLLVVLKQPVRWAAANPDYKGLYRGPGWPTGYPEEEEPCHQYVWGPYMDDSQGGLIPTEELARELYHLFDVSPREFEIIYASTPDDPPGPSRGPLLGYDVACSSPFWSIVADWHSDPEFTSFLDRLNANGLLATLEDASDFLETFRAVHPEGEETILHLWRIEAVV